MNIDEWEKRIKRRNIVVNVLALLAVGFFSGGIAAVIFVNWLQGIICILIGVVLVWMAEKVDNL